MYVLRQNREANYKTGESYLTPNKGKINILVFLI